MVHGPCASLPREVLTTSWTMTHRVIDAVLRTALSHLCSRSKAFNSNSLNDQRNTRFERFVRRAMGHAWIAS